MNTLHHAHRLVQWTCVIPALLMLSGCTERLARENVFANTETLLGISIAENPATQLYEARIGYARHELFYVPTGKLVRYVVDPATGKLIESPTCCGSNDASITPEVLAEIQVNGSAPRGGPSFELRQKLAVGKAAVDSGGAIALMADDAQTALAAARIADILKPSPARQKLLDELDALLEQHKTINPPREYKGAQFGSGSLLLNAVAESEFNDTLDNVKHSDRLSMLVAAFKAALGQ